MFLHKLIYLYEGAPNHEQPYLPHSNDVHTRFFVFLISAFASFFTGVKVGADKTEAKYSQLKDHPSAQEFSGSYQQQDLVTFYHNVFLPLPGIQAQLERTAGRSCPQHGCPPERGNAEESEYSGGQAV